MFRHVAAALILLLTLTSTVQQAAAVSEAEKTFLSMYFTDDELVIVSATRSLKSITRIAENVEVVTKEDIELLNAHTLADVLNGITGVQVYFAGASPTSVANVSIQGSKYDEVVFFLDGIPLNDLSTNLTIVSDIPVQFIEKVEIIKGPASSVWGSSLGGVVNIVTKGPGRGEKVGGTLSASYGKDNTVDLRAEAYGRRDKLGVYLAAGRLQTDGLKEIEEGWRSDLYAKATYDFSQDTGLSFTLGYFKSRRERGDYRVYYDSYDRDKFERFLSTVSLNSNLSSEVDLNVSLRAMHQRRNYYSTTLSTGDEFEDVNDDSLYGGTAKLTWKRGPHTVVAGTDYDDGGLEWSSNIGDTLHLRKWAVFINDTITFGKFTVTPGIRYDDSNRFENFVSPSLGIACEVLDKTILRAYVSRGFNSPTLGQLSGDFGDFRHNPDLRVAKVWSYQAGLETGLLKFVWLKATAFRHDIKDGIVWEFIDDTSTYWTYVNRDRIRRQGVEVQMRTAPIYNTTLAAGATVIDTEDRVTGEDIIDIANSTFDVSLKYDDEKTFRALLRGHYIWFNSDAYHLARYNSVIVDFNAIKEVYRKNNQRIEVFVTGHNLFNGSQYWDELYKNAGRWIEAGVRARF